MSIQAPKISWDLLLEREVPKRLFCVTKIFYKCLSLQEYKDVMKRFFFSSSGKTSKTANQSCKLLKVRV